MPVLANPKPMHDYAEPIELPVTSFDVVPVSTLLKLPQPCSILGLYVVRDKRGKNFVCLRVSHCWDDTGVEGYYTTNDGTFICEAKP